MKKTISTLLGVTALVILLASACSTAAAPSTQPAAAQPNQPAPAGATFAPACQSATSCAAPDVSDAEGVNTYCVKKIPYQNISVDPGTTFESLDPNGDLKCVDSGTVANGKEIITCTGQQLITYQLKLTNTSCGGGSLQTGTANCAQGQGYDAANNCCAPVGGSSGGSKTIYVNIGACPTK